MYTLERDRSSCDNDSSIWSNYQMQTPLGRYGAQLYVRTLYTDGASPSPYVRRVVG